MIRMLRAVGRGMREALLTLAAAGGAVCIVLVVLAFTGGFSLMMFKTGSMAPTIPARSVALVQEITAAQIAVGDIVTVAREDELPVTHRVTSIASSGDPEARVITMRGDANDVDDPAPYVVTDVRIVRGSLPHLANLVVWLAQPLVLGCITLGAALLVGWAFWPRSRKEEADAAVSDVPADEAPAGDGPVSVGAALRRDRRT